MAPMKRGRNDGDDEAVAVESASSHLRLSASHKRARLSVSQNANKPRGHERSPSTSSSEDEQLPDADEDVASGPPATQYEIMRDNGFKHLENPDADDALATQAFQRRRGRIGQNVAAENAIIEEVTCINFMCHTKLHVKLGPLINFVVGMNGSGKSAVLTAITLCLGGKASATNRGASLKSLIRGGQEQAILIVRLKNEGADAYQPDIYGHSIIVERHFSKSGSSGYKLKSAVGRTISTKKGDVDDIIEYFNLQVDNPMNVLTQDAAKSFIRDSTAAQKYQFFVEGVQLAQLDNDYRLVSDTCDAIESKLDEGEKDLKVLKKKYEVAEERAKIVHQHKDMKEAAGRMRNQLVWVQIKEQEDRLQRREDNVAVVEGEITEAERKAQDKDDAFQQVDATLKIAEASVQQLEEELIPLTDEETAAKETHNEARSSLESIHTTHRQIQTSLRAAKNNVVKITKSIDDENQRIADANGGARSRKVAKVEEAQQAVTAAKEALDQSEAESLQLAEQYRSAENEARNLAAPLSVKREEVKSCESRLHDLKTNRVNVMSGYDAAMPRLLQAIRSDGGFREAPVGPMGMHIKLLNPMWSNTIESVLGNTLNGFVVTSKADQTRLSAMLKSFKMEHFCPVIIGNHNPINTAGNEPDSRYETILRVLEFDNDLVRRQLIIQYAIEQSLLIRERRDGYRTMFSGAKPNYIRCCYTLHDSRRDFGHRLSYGGRNHADEDMSGVKYTGRKPRMKTDAESQVTQQQDTLDYLRRELKELESRHRQLQQAVRDCKDSVDKHKRDHQQQKASLQKADDRVEVLQSELDRDNVEDGRLDAFNAELAEAQGEVTMYEETLINAIGERNRLNAISTTKKSELDAVKVQVADQNAKINKAKGKARNLTAARHNVLTEKNRAFEQVTTLESKLDYVKRQRDEQAEVVVDHTNQATAICQRVTIPDGVSQAAIQTKYDKIQAAIKTYNKNLGATDEVIMLEQEDALGRFQTAKGHLENMVELLAILKLSFKKRMEQFRRFQQYISARSRIGFSYLLCKRAFRGKLTIDHEKKLLDVDIEPDETTKSSKGRGAKTLSGGEKSFSSICLLLALWDAMGAPLRCLDEYDVFMDDVNRGVSTEMIISAARSSTSRQYIMITPKALENAAADAPDVKIHKLEDPRENQKRIDEMLQAA